MDRFALHAFTQNRRIQLDLATKGKVCRVDLVRLALRDANPTLAL